MKPHCPGTHRPCARWASQPPLHILVGLHLLSCTAAPQRDPSLDVSGTETHHGSSLTAEDAGHVIAPSLQPADASLPPKDAPATVCANPDAVEGCAKNLQTLDWWVHRAETMDWAVFLMRPVSLSETDFHYDSGSGFAYDYVEIAAHLVVDRVFEKGKGVPDEIAMKFQKEGCYEPTFTEVFKGEKNSVRILCFDGYDGASLMPGAQYVVFANDPYSTPQRVYSVEGGVISSDQAKMTGPVSMDEVAKKFAGD